LQKNAALDYVEPVAMDVLVDCAASGIWNPNSKMDPKKWLVRSDLASTIYCCWMAKQVKVTDFQLTQCYCEPRYVYTVGDGNRLVVVGEAVDLQVQGFGTGEKHWVECSGVLGEVQTKWVWEVVWEGWCREVASEVWMRGRSSV